MLGKYFDAEGSNLEQKIDAWLMDKIIPETTREWRISRPTQSILLLEFTIENQTNFKRQAESNDHDLRRLKHTIVMQSATPNDCSNEYLTK